MPGIATITASRITPPPAWAVLERQLITTMEKGVEVFNEKYTTPDGNMHFIYDVDDVFESRVNRGLLYSVGGSSKFKDLAIREWNATARFYSEEFKPSPVEQHPHLSAKPDILSQGERSNRWKPGSIHPMYMAQLHNEFWTLAIPFNADWFHIGEGLQSFHELPLVDPTIEENIRRARRYASFYNGEDPSAPNYDPKHKIIRSPFGGSKGPMLRAIDAPPMVHEGGYVSNAMDLARYFLDPASYGDFGHRRGVASKPSAGKLMTPLYPIVKELEPNWFEDPKRRDEILRLFEDIVLNGDEPTNLPCTGLMAMAYMYTGEDKYRQWVEDYVGAWIDRTKKNGGIMPDNIGPTGKIGEKRNGQWWGGMHGWNRRGGCDRMFTAIAIGVEAATLVSGDTGYLDLLRSQLRLLLDNSIKREDGQLLLPNRYGPEGWAEHRPWTIKEFVHLFNASQKPEDYQMIAMLREGNRTADWNDVPSGPDPKGGRTDTGRFQYYDGKLADWPERLVEAEIQFSQTVTSSFVNDHRSLEQILEDNIWPANPLVMKGLTHLVTGGPQHLYNGGLQTGSIRIFDPDRARPGMPEDVGVLVDEIKADRTGVQLVNLDPVESRRVIVQGGTYGEHQFTDVSYTETDRNWTGTNPGTWIRAKATSTDRSVPVNNSYFEVVLPPATGIRVSAGMKRYANKPSYAFPWTR
ncbi:MAG: hypothetical protein FJ319_00835 [SAR202 cluster bacterium]|nr:hypothetical protein [SAR202 cluster bacterium]